MPWSGEHRGFAMRTFLENGRSVVATQRAFRLHFNIPRHGPIPDGKAIRRWVEALEESGSTRRPRGSGRPKTVKTPENVALVKAAVEQSPRRSARKHSIALAMYNRSLRRILLYDLSFHLYKIRIVQELKPTDFENRSCNSQLATDIPGTPRLSEGWCRVAPTLTWFEHLRLLPVGISKGESVQKSAKQFGRIEDANSGGNRCNTPWEVPKSSRKLQTSPSTVHRYRWPPSSWCHLQKVITQTALYTDSNKTTNKPVCIVLLFLIDFQNSGIWFAPPCTYCKIRFLIAGLPKHISLGLEKSTFIRVGEFLRFQLTKMLYSKLILPNYQIILWKTKHTIVFVIYWCIS